MINMVELIISVFENIMTIIGVVSALWIYWSWRKDYKAKKNHEYSIELLKKIKILHRKIEFIRAPKFYDQKTIRENIERMYIPKIEEIKAIGNDVMTDLLISDHVFIKCENFQSSFKSYIIDKVIKEIDRAVLDFFISLKERSPSVMETALFRILYPFEVSSEKMKESSFKNWFYYR